MKEELRILMLEDQEDDAGLIDHVLRKERIRFTRKRVDTRDGFVDALSSFNPDIIISDHALPQFNSIEALLVCQTMDIRIPFLLVTGSVSEEFAVNCLKRGVDDYILKTNLSRLPQAIQNSLQTRDYARQRQFDEDKLKQQYNELIKINKELDSFVYSISHNLRSPLSSVMGIIRIARIEMNSTAEFNPATYFDKIENSVNRLDVTLKEILDYSQNARSELTISRIDLKELILQCFENVSFQNPNNLVQLKLEITEKVPLYSDKQRLTVILVSLLSNAIKFRDETKDTCTINIRGDITPLKIDIDIVDNGIGIQPELHSRIFDMFFRASERSDGAGLGLYIVKETIDKLRGAVSITSRQFEETSVHLQIPNSLTTI